MYICTMNLKQLEIFKALSNKTRLEILQWLKDPEASFPAQVHAGFEVGVCVGEIQKNQDLRNLLFRSIYLFFNGLVL